MANRTRSKKRSKNKKSKKMYMQRGGVFTQEEEDILLNQGGYNQQQIDFLNQNNVSFQNIQTATNYVLDNNQHTIACFIASCLQNEDNQNPQNEMAPDFNIDDLQGEGEDDPAFNDAFIQDDNNAELNNSGVTDPEQGSFSFDEEDGDGDDGDDELGWNEEDENPQQGGRRRKTRKGRKGKKSRKTKKQRGGMRYGTGVGSNCFEPNYSIYNTPTLSLFPYKPN
jgi:hypothetical protein